MIKYSMTDIEYHAGIKKAIQRQLADSNNIPITKGERAGDTGPVLGYTFKDAMRLMTAHDFLKIKVNGKQMYVRKCHLRELP